MNPSPAQQWSALSALYEHADGLAADALAAWLLRLEAEGNPLLPQLRRMLAARAEFETNDFLATLPKFGGSEPRAPAAWAEGRQVGAYRLLKPLGEGGMAEVWLAERADGAIKRRVAIKLPFPRPGRETFAVRFDRERDILATLRHPNIAGLYDAGVTPDGQAWLALEYVDGEPLSAWCDQQRLGLRERVMLFRQVLLAVQHAHANLVIHRDLKPGNILVTPQGEVRLLDFGIAKLLEAEGDAIAETELTRQAGRTMTPRYASPEQLTGAPLTTGSDVYSLGVVFYELLCGERPYELKLESPGQLEHAILEIEPRAPSRRALSESNARERGGATVKALRRALAPELDAIALRCLAKQPAARFASVDAVIADIDRWLGGEAVLARAPSAWYRFRKFAARHRLGVALGAAAVASLVATTAVAVVMGLQAREESARAVAARDFMLSIFKRADQEKSRGADISARDILETGRKDVMSRLAGQPRLQAELLQGMGEVQSEMGEFSSAGNTFAEVALVYAQLNMPREATLAYVDQADSALRAGDLESAVRHHRTAATLPGRPRSDARVEARLHEVAGWISLGQGDASIAKSSFMEAKRLVPSAFEAHDTRALRPLQGLIYSETQLQNFDAALRYQDELEAQASQTVEKNPKEWAVLDEGRSGILYMAGRYAQGLPHAAEAVIRCEKAQLRNNEYCRRLRLQRMRFALRLGVQDQVIADLGFVDSLQTDPTAQYFQVDALSILLRTESVGGSPERQMDLRKRLQATLNLNLPTTLDPIVRAIALLALAEDSLRAGETAVARRWLAQAQDIQVKLGSAAPPTLGAVSTLLAGISQLHEHRAEAALALVTSAHQSMEGSVGKEHPLSLIFSLNRAIALDALGRTNEAMGVVAEAASRLRGWLGPESATLARAQNLIELLERRLSRSPPAANAESRRVAPHNPARPVTRDFFT